MNEPVRVGLSAHGLGVFSLRRFRAHERIGPIEGTVTDDPGYESDYCMELSDELAIEPDAPFRYLNHSCRPNCALVAAEANGNDGRFAGPQLWLEVQTEVAWELAVEASLPRAIVINKLDRDNASAYEKCQHAIEDQNMHSTRVAAAANTAINAIVKIAFVLYIKGLLKILV